MRQSRHLYYEGRTKIESQGTSDPFSSEGYLRNATGPFAQTFRNLVPDVDSLDTLDPAFLEQTWDDELRRVAAHFQFTERQQADAQTVLDEVKAQAEAWFADPETAAEITDYKESLTALREGERTPPALAFERERLQEARIEVEAARRKLVAPIEQWTAELRARWAALAEPDQIETAGALGPPPSPLDRIDAITMYGLTLCGLALMAGFLTPLAALGGAGFLFLFYISNPPFPGLPPNPKAEGTYLFVNKNLIEMLALLVLATTPNGLWFGVDRLFFGWIGRRAANRAELAEARTSA
ncbi:DoxX family protein [Tautonia sociabilis]|uniref:DoxX family protein n=1 Tax=Tautonia sociabilis TaxID=2080755 RepID=A0A432MI00_9BACT|nr:DoxX family protein [Tautonia sociabilis]RUL86764.1 DoxX family protein [Tautonia sociabilis]